MHCVWECRRLGLCAALPGAKLLGLLGMEELGLFSTRLK